MSQENLTDVKKLIAQYQKSYLHSATRWRVSYRALLVLSAIFSSFAAIVSQFTELKIAASNDISSILAALAAISTTLIAALDFEVNWRINNKSLHEVNVLMLAAEKSDANGDQLLSELQNVIRGRVDGVRQD